MAFIWQKIRWIGNTCPYCKSKETFLIVDTSKAECRDCWEQFEV